MNHNRSLFRFYVIAGMAMGIAMGVWVNYVFTGLALGSALGITVAIITMKKYNQR